MAKLSHNELITLLLAISIMLVFSRILAEMGRKFKLPVVMGELLVGIILGPTILGAVLPGTEAYLFTKAGNVPVALDAITSLSVIMLLFVTGMEVQLPMVIRQGKVAVYTSLLSMIIPFAMGFAAAYFLPQVFHFFWELLWQYLLYRLLQEFLWI
jgi:Kef-type K+ transport system membrane component KefB